MKIKNTFLTVLLGIAISAFGQEQIEFSNEFKAESEYLIRTTSETSTVVTFDAPEDFLNRLKSKGVENPQITDQTTEMRIAYITGKEKKGTMPIEIKYLETGLPQDGLIRNGESLRGTYSLKDKIKVSGLPDKNRIDMEANQIMAILSDGLSVDLFNSGKLSIGDSISITSPMNFPIGPYQITYNIINAYVLKSITSGKADFIISSSCELKSDYPEINLSASGGGVGNCTYDYEQKRIISKSSELKITMTAELPNDVKMKMALEITSTETTKIK